MDDFAQARTHMVDSQIHTAGVTLPGVLRAFETVPREHFAPEYLRQIAYCDDNLPVGEGRFLLNPMVHAKMVQALAPSAQDIALDIGGGTGYSAAILSSLVMTVVAIEESVACLDFAAKIWSETGICNIAGVQGGHADGAPGEAPFDIIFINGALCMYRTV
ncbi:MAG: protein-L-isoaspartate O-methyltransferase [Alphaproteobacteria bacterium]